MRLPFGDGPLLALDGASSQISAAIGREEEVLVQRAVEADRSSSTLLRLVDDCLAETGLDLSDLVGIVSLRGPGSFTGLRVTLALTQGFGQALDLPTGTVSTFEALAYQVDPSCAALAVVEAGHRTWNAQLFRPGSPRRPASDAVRLATDRLLDPASAANLQPVIVGFDLAAAGLEDSETVAAARPLARSALALADRAEWGAEGLTEPLYLSPPPADDRARRRGDSDAADPPTR